MQYNNLFINKDEIEKFNNYIVIKKNNNYTNINNIYKLKEKIKELETKILFKKKYDNNLILDDYIDNILINTITSIDNLINKINKEIIINGQFNRNNNKTNYTEYEF